MIAKLKEGSSKIVWLDFSDYAIRLFGKGYHDYLKSPESFISIVSQGQALLKSDVVSINVESFYADYINENKELVQTWANRKLGFAVKKLLASVEPKEIINEILSGLFFLYEHSKPLVIIVPSPKAWIRLIIDNVGDGTQRDIDSNQIEAASIYQAEWLGGFSKVGLAGIVIKEDLGSEMDMDSNLESYQPILNIADHYQWNTGVYFNNFSNPLLKLNDRFDFTLCTSNSIGNLLPLWEKGESTFGGLNAEFWLGEETSSLPSNALMFGEIPPESEPEMVLLQLKKIRS